MKFNIDLICIAGIVEIIDAKDLLSGVTHLFDKK